VHHGLLHHHLAAHVPASWAHKAGLATPGPHHLATGHHLGGRATADRPQRGPCCWSWSWASSRPAGAWYHTDIRNIPLSWALLGLGQGLQGTEETAGVLS
jgi:hypothetical protein